ncbi:MAG: 3-phosphoshikimate 1-carboxyvinyltransferase [Polyangiaceae bacterium]|nr:3-phosphoshikimate 1-carboxyvinyltransferase [Polyangiaceae bacterium]
MTGKRLVIEPARRALRGSVAVPSDKSISHRALIFAALSNGNCTLRRFSYGEDNVSTLQAFVAMGVQIADNGPGEVAVRGVGLRGLREPDRPLDCGNSGTTMRLMTGVLAAQPFRSELVGDASLSRRPMGRVVFPLVQRGAVITGRRHPSRSHEVTAPLEVGALVGKQLGGLDYRLPMASAQLKSALLLSGLFASGPTRLSEPVVSRDHTERMMQALGMPLRAAGATVELQPLTDAMAIPGFELDLPGDLSAAAFVLVAGLLVDQSEVTTRHTGLNPTRCGFLDAVRQFGGDLAVAPRGSSLNEPHGEVSTRSSRLRAASIGGELAVRSIDEIPILAALAARAVGTTEFSDVDELRVKESDRIAATVRLLGAFGVEADEHPTGFVVRGQPDGALKAGRVDSGGDHRLAMTAAILGLVADGPTFIENVDCIATSFPRFVETLSALGATLRVEG